VRLFGKKVNNNVILSSNKFELPAFFGAKYTNRSVIFMHSSSVAIKQNMASLSFIVNHAENNQYYFNSSFIHGEFNYTYSFLKKFSLTSGTGYYFNDGWNQQIGVKQQLTVVGIGKLQFDVGVDYKKAIQTIRPVLANQFFLNSSMHYRF
jgi:hypothetical protein